MKRLKSFIVLALILLFYSFTFAAYSNLKEAINASGSNKSYSLTKKETVTENLGQLNGTKLTIYGNGYEVDGNYKVGVRIYSGTLNINKGSGNSFVWGYFVNEKDYTKVDDICYFKGGAIYNKGNLNFSNNITFSRNEVSWTLTGYKDMYVYGGAIYNDGGKIVIGSNNTFSGNRASSGGISGMRAYGGAIYNTAKGDIQIGNNATFDSNFAHAYNDNNRHGCGGAIFNDTDSTITIGSNSIFSSNDVYKNGGAICNNYGTITFKDGAKFINNIASAKGGAIWNEGRTINLIANTNNVEFTGNTANGVSNAISNAGGIINLWASENADVIFNDRITGSGTINVNKSTTTLTANGKIVLNENMSGFTGKVQMYNGEIELKAKKSGTSQINTNKFFNGNIILSSGTLNVLNNAIDNITVSTWTSTANSNLKFDANLSDNTSDNFTVTNSASGELNLTAINILGVNGTSGQITLFKNSKSPTLNILTTANYGGYEYTFTNSGTSGVLNYLLTGYKTLKESVNATVPEIRSYSLSEKETVTADLGNLGGTQLTIFGNGYEVDGNSKAGIAIGQEQILNIEKGTGENFVWKNFYKNNNGGVIYNSSGTVTVASTTFESNRARGNSSGSGSDYGGYGYGGAIYNDYGTIAIDSATFKSNNASGYGSSTYYSYQYGYGYGGAIYNDYGMINISSTIFELNSASGYGTSTSYAGTGRGYGGAIYNNNETITIDSTTFKSNTAMGYAHGGSGYGGAIYNNKGTINISSTMFESNSAGGSDSDYDYGYGGAIYNDNGTIVIASTTFKSNRAIGSTYSYGGAIYTAANSTTTFMDGVKFTNNEATKTQGGAIYNEGITNLIASIDDIEFTGNTANGISNAIHDKNGTINLYASDTNSIIFNDRITSENTTSILNVNQSSGTLPTIGKVILNEDMSAYKGAVNLYGGEIELQAKTSGNNTNTNKFFSGNINLSSGTLNILNNAIDNITVSNFTSTANSNLKFDTDLSNNTSDNFTVTNSASGELNLTAINILGVNGTSGQITLFKNLKAPTLNILTTANYGGYEYTFTNSGTSGVLNYLLTGYKTLKETVNATSPATRSYSLSEKETVTADLGDLGGTQLTIFGNGYEVDGNGKAGINVSTGRTLNIEKGVGETFSWNNFNKTGHGTVIFNEGTTNISQNIEFYLNTGTRWGGAIYNNNTLNIDSNVVFTSNTAKCGGAVINFGGITDISSSTFTNNMATLWGGAVENAEYGTLNITSALFSSNTATQSGGAVQNLKGTTTISSSTFIGNFAQSYGGAIANEDGGTLIISSSIFTKNRTGETGGVLKNNDGTINITLSSFDENVSDSVGGAIFNDVGTITISSSSFTKNKAESDTGRCSGGAIDIDVDGIITIKDSSSFSENRAKLGGAIENNGIATIMSSVFSGNVATEIGGAIDNSNRLTIEKSVFTNNTANIGGAIENKDENTGVVLISSSLFNSNTATNIGGAIHNNENLTVTIQDGTKFINNTANIGGAIYNEGGILNIYSALFSSNTATQRGGAIQNLKGTTTIAVSTFIGNSAQNNAGAIANRDDATLIISSSMFSKNQTDGTGGVIKNDIGIIDITSSIFAENSAVGVGGAIFNSKGTITISSSSFTKNKAESDTGKCSGGAIDIDVDGIITIKDSSSFSENRAKLGGAIENNGRATIISSLFSGNIATEVGGAIDNSNRLTIEKSVFTNNTANIGGAIENKDENTGVVLISSSLFNSNTATNIGGAIHNNENLTVTIQDGTEFINNTARNGGGAIYNAGNLEIIETKFSSNSATLYGGAIYNNGNLDIEDNGYYYNNSAQVGGAIFNSENYDTEVIGHIVISSNTKFLNNTATDSGGAISNNSGIVTIYSSSTFTNNSACNGGAIQNSGGEIYIGNNAIFDSNIAEYRGGAINSIGGSLTIGENSQFINNKTSNNYGGAIWFEGYNSDVERNSLTFLGNALFYNNAAATINSSAIHGRGGIITFKDGALFKDNEGGAIVLDSWSNGQGTTELNLIANTNNVEFTGNNIAIAEWYGGTINLWASENADIIFNDKIVTNITQTGCPDSILNINQSSGTLPTTGKIILNADMSRYNRGIVNLYSGEIELQAKTEEGSNINTNKFFTGNINLMGDSTLNIQNNAIDNITVSNLTSPDDTNLKFDTDLSNNTSDNFTITNNVIGQLNLDSINILGVDEKIGQITLFNNGKAPTLNILTTGNYGGQEYVFTNSDVAGVLDYRLLGYKTFKEVVNETEPAIRSYSLAENELVTEDLGRLGGTQLTIFGNGYEVNGSSKAGIMVGNGQTLNIEKGTGENFVWKNFHSDTLGSVIMNIGTLNIEDNVVFSSNSTTDAGGVITNHYNLTIGNNVIFSSNTAKNSGGAIRNVSISNIGGGNISIGDNVKFSSNTSRTGGAIYIVSGDMNIGDNAEFNLNTADTFAGAIYFSGNSVSTIGENSVFTSNTAGVEAGAISNGGSNITIGSNSSFYNNSSGKLGGAIYASENSTTTIRSGAVFSSNTVSSVSNNEYAKGGAIYNNTNSIMTIGDDASFTKNSTIAKDESLGGVFYNFYCSNITIGNNILFSSNSCIGTGDTTSSVGGVMYNSSSTVTIGNQVNISNNKTNAMYASGGAIFNDYYSSMNIGNDVSFSSNSCVGNYLGYGGALYTSNSNNTIGNNASFIGNKTIAETESYGGAIVDWNRSNITIGSNAIFSFNSAESTETNGKSKGGAIYIAGDDIVRTVFTITDGAQFTNNTSLSQNSDSYGGAIYNEKGIINLIANTINVEFSNNKANGVSNAIHDNVGIINLWASSNADIIFNDRITSENSTSILNVNQSSGTLPTIGKVILNEDMNGYKGAVNLYGGEIELQAKTSGNNINTNKFFTGNINLSSGTLNIQNNSIDNITISNFISTENSNLKFDTDLSNNTSDNFTVTNNASGELNLTAINLLGVDEETGTIILFNDEKSPELNVLTTGVYNGYEYSFSTTTQKGVLDYKLTGTNKTFKEVVNDITPGYRSYSLANNETVTQDLGQLGGTQLTVFGNGFEVNGNSKAGINVSNGQTLNIDKGTGEKFSWNNFNKTGHGTVIFNEGTTNISSNVEFYLNTGTRWGGAIYNNEILNIDSNVVFTSNTARCGGAIINYGGTTDISSSTFTNNIATLWGGALENTEYGTLNITSALFSSNIATQSGGAIQSLEGTITISSSTFIGNSAQSYGGAIANADGGIVIISSSAFSKNQTNGTGGAINNNDDGIINITSSTFSENIAGVVGGAVFNCQGTISISSSSFTKNKAESDTGRCSGGAIDNNVNGIITIKDSSSFYENTAKLGGAIENNGTATIISSVFNGNIATEIGGAIDNSNRLTIENSVFTNNTANVGGAIENKDENMGVVFISSSLFNSNTATNIGGAIHNNENLTVTIQDGTRFTNNTATTNGGAIYNEGILNLIADTDNIEFTGNTANGISNAIHDNGGIVNLWASENADIIFNDRIASENSSSILNINNSTTTLTANGKVILNEDMSGWVGTTNLYNGNLEITEGNNFINGNFTIHGGTFTANANSIITDFTNNGTVNLTGGTIANNISGLTDGIINIKNNDVTINDDVFVNNNNIKLGTTLKLLNEESLNTSTLTICNGAILNTQNNSTGTINANSIVIEDGANWTYQLDVDLKSAKADNLINIESVGNGSKATIDDIHLLSDKATKTSIQIADNDIKATIAQDNFKIYTTNLSYGVTTSLDSNSNTLLNIEAVGYGGLANAVYDGASSYSVTEDIDYLTKWIEDPIGTTNNQLKGNLTISNISSNNRVLKSTNNVEGLITEGYTLQINNVNLEGFNDAIKVNNANGNLQLTNVKFSSNTGNAVITSSGTVELSGVVFDNTNTATIDIINNNKLILSGSSTTFTTGVIGKGTTTINGVNINLADAIIEQNKIEINSNGSLTANASNITADIENNSNLIFSEGTNNNYIFGTGTTIIDGEVINSSTIANNVTINSQKQFTTNATNIDGQIENNGDLIFNAGTNDNYIYGDGNVSIEGYVISNSSITQSTVTVASTGKFENNNKLQLIDYINNGTTINNSTISVSGEYYNVGITTNTNYIKANIYTNKENSVMDNTGIIDADEFNIENGSVFSTSFDNLITKGDFENDGEVTVKGGEIKNNIIGEGKLIIENLVVNNKDINQSSITINTEATLTNNENITIDQILTNNGQLTNEGNIETEQLNNVANSTITNNSNFTVNKKGQNYGRIDGNGILNINDDFDNFSYLRQNLINISSGTFNNENIVISNGINLQEKSKLMSDASNISGNILNAGNVILTGGENNNWIYGTGTTIIDGEVINSSTIVNNVKINETKKLTTSAESINGDILNNGILIINSGKENNNKITGIGKLYINCNLTNNNIIRQKELSLNLNPNIQFASSLNTSDNSSQLSVFTNNSEITVETLNLKDTMLKLTEKGSLAVDNLSSQNSAMDLANSLTQQHNFKTISVTDKLDLAVDVDLKNKTMDTISADIYDEEGNIDINKINIITELKGNNTEIAFTTSTVLKDKITSITTASSNLFKYNVEYNKNAGTLNFSVTAKDNPTMVAGQVANIADGLITQTTVLNQAFSSIDNIRNKITSAKEKGLLYASTADVVFDNSNKLERGLWLRPFYSQESINFDSLSVDNTLTGTLAGIDLVTSENSLVSVYLGYAGSEQKYEDIKVSQTGYIVGATGMLIKDDWYAGLTANINFNKAESQSDYGTDSFDMNMYSVGAKAGYNYEINDKWTLEPNLTLMYGNVNSAEYQTTQGAKVEGQSVANIIVAPQVKAKLGLTNGWQPYGLLGYVINCGNKVKANVEGVEFEQQKIENYFEFGIGINKEFINTPWNCYLQVTGRSGDRSGFDSSLGIKYKF